MSSQNESYIQEAASSEDMRPYERASLAISKQTHAAFESYRMKRAAQEGRVIKQDECLWIMIKEAEKRLK
jgi:hypothetical protein